MISPIGLFHGVIPLARTQESSGGNSPPSKSGPPVASPSWTDLGLKASPEEFADTFYAFETSGHPGRFPIFGPWHTVTLKGNPKVVVPWSHPYLRQAWREFLYKAGVTSFTHWFPSNTGLTIRYLYKDKPFVNETITERGIVFTFFTPSLRERPQIFTVKQPTKSNFEIELPRDPQSRSFGVTIYGRRLPVEAYFPDSMTMEQRTTVLKTLGETFQSLPKGMALPFLEGKGQERPLQVVLCTREKAAQIGVLRDGNVGDSYYDRAANRVWISPTDPEILPALAHEVMGHAYADFLRWEDNEGSLVDIEHSPLRDYYRWKLMKIFTPEEFFRYDTLVKKTRARETTLGGENKGGSHTKLESYREKASKRFLTNYAVEGDEGPVRHALRPEEDFAIIQESFACLFQTRRTSCGPVFSRSILTNEPFLNLVGLERLFSEYGTKKIGALRREEVFSHKAFKDVLGINLEDVDTRFGPYSDVVQLPKRFMGVRPHLQALFPLSGEAYDGELNLGLGLYFANLSPRTFAGILLEGGLGTGSDGADYINGVFSVGLSRQNRRHAVRGHIGLGVGGYSIEDSSPNPKRSGLFLQYSGMYSLRPVEALSLGLGLYLRQSIREPQFLVVAPALGISFSF